MNVRQLQTSIFAASLNRPSDLAQDVAAYSYIIFRRAPGLPLDVGLRNPCTIKPYRHLSWNATCMDGADVVDAVDIGELRIAFRRESR